MFSDWPRSRIKIQDPNAILMIDNDGRMNSSFHLVSSAGFRDKISLPINVSGTVSLMFFLRWISRAKLLLHYNSLLRLVGRSLTAFRQNWYASLAKFVFSKIHFDLMALYLTASIP